MVGDRQQRVGVRRQIDADDVRFLVDGVVDEAGILVGEAVVVLTPDVGGQQIIERCDGRAPGNLLARDLEPLGVLIEHRVDDVNERLVAGKQTVPAGEQIAFEPALAGVLAQASPSPARRSRDDRRPGLCRRARCGRSPRSSASQRLELVSSGLKTRKLRASRLSFITSRRKSPMTRVASAYTTPGCSNFDRIGAKVRHTQIAAASRPPLA